MAKDAYVYRIGGGGRLRILLEEKPPDRPSPGTGAARKEEDGRLDAVRLSDPVYVVEDETIEFLDLATTLLGPRTPYEYTEDSQYVAPYNRDVTFGPLGNITAVREYVADSDLARLDGLMFDPARRNFTRLDSGRKVPNVLPLNYNSPSGLPLNLNLYAGGHQYLVNGVSANREWKWVKRDVTGEVWATSNTLHDLAPQTGHYAAKKLHPYSRLSLGDSRYWPFDTGDSHWKLTSEPSFASPTTSLKLAFPLRVFGIPLFYRPFEHWNAVATTYTLPAYPTFSNRPFCQVTLDETGINFVGREPEIPTPGFTNALNFLNRFPAMIRVERITIIDITQPDGSVTHNHTVEYLNRRPYDTTTLLNQCTDIGRAQLASPGLTTRDVAGGSNLFIASGFLTGPASSLPYVQNVGHLSGIIEAAGKVFYVWRAS